MKKPSSKIRDDITKLQEQLKIAETRDAERIGRVALKVGLGDLDIDEGDLQAAFEEVAKRFRADEPVSAGKRRGANPVPTPTLAAGTNEGNGDEA